MAQLGQTCLRSVVLGCAVVARMTQTAWAQQAVPVVEVAGQISSVGSGSLVPGATPSAAGTATVVFNLSRLIGFEAQGSWTPDHEPQIYAFQGGRTVLASAGLRGTFRRTPRVVFYGTLLAGAYHVTDAVTGFTTDPATGAITCATGPATHVLLVTGLGATLALSRHLFFQVDAAARMTSAPAQSVVLGRSSRATLIETLPGETAASATVSVGVGYGFGARSWPADGSPSLRSANLVVGPLATYRESANLLDGSRESEPGLGGFVSYRVATHYWLDGSADWIRGVSQTTPFEGGRVVETLGGLRAGVETPRLGLFVKAAAGTIRESRTVTAVTDAGVPSFGPLDTFALDLGAVFDVYVSRLVWRFEAGDTQTFLHATTVVGGTPRLSSRPGVDSMQLTSAFGWRF